MKNKKLIIIIGCVLFLTAGGIAWNKVFKGPEGTNGTLINPYDVYDETHRIRHLKQGDPSTDSILVHNNATDYSRRVSFTQLASSIKVPVTYSGTTNASGNYTVTFPVAYSTPPNIQASITNQGNTNQFIRVSSVSTTGFTVNVFQRSAVTLLSVEVLLAATTNVSGANVDVLVTQK